MKDVQIIQVPGHRVLRELYDDIARHPETGLWPVILGQPDSMDTIEEMAELNAENAGSEADILQRSSEIDVPAWFARARAEAYGEDEGEETSADDGEWPTQLEPPMEIVTHLDVLSQKPHPEVLIGLFRVDEPWKVFAKMLYGGWNACPGPEEHCAVQAYWARRYGSQVISATESVVQCIVANPPTDREGALALAREQYAYCGDIVDQGTETIANLAAGLLRGKVWYFWWD